MSYYTLLVYIRAGKYRLFYSCEKKVLPLLAKHNGKLELRLKTLKTKGSKGLPDEIHIISFKTSSGLKNYLSDKNRKKLLPLFNKSLLKSDLIEGIKIP